jgi:hypothetical protein
MELAENVVRKERYIAYGRQLRGPGLDVQVVQKLIYLLTPWSRVLLEKLNGFQPLKKFSAFWNPEGSSPHSQVPVNCPYPEPAPPSPYPHIHFLKIYLNITLPSKSGSPKWPPSFISPPKPCICLSSPPYVLHAPIIPLFSILSPEKYWVRSTDH